MYKLQDVTLKTGGNRLSISVAAVRRKGVLSNEMQERQNLLVSLVHDGDTGWLGEFYPLFSFDNFAKSVEARFVILIPNVLLFE